MCTLFEEIAKESELRGELRGESRGKLIGELKGIIESGFDFGLSENDILERLQKKLNLSFEAAQEYLEMYEKNTL